MYVERTEGHRRGTGGEQHAATPGQLIADESSSKYGICPHKYTATLSALMWLVKPPRMITRHGISTAAFSRVYTTLGVRLSAYLIDKSQAN